MRYKFVAVLVSGGLAGLGGGFLAMVASSNYRDGQTGGRGYIGLAAMIFGNWRPGGLLWARACSATPRRSACARAATPSTPCCSRSRCWRWRGGRGSCAAASSAAAWSRPVGGVLLGVVYFLIDEVPGDFTAMTPYVVTLLVLAFASQRLRMPAADGQIYRKGSAG